MLESSYHACSRAELIKVKVHQIRDSMRERDLEVILAQVQNGCSLLVPVHQFLQISSGPITTLGLSAGSALITPRDEATAELHCKE